MVEYNLVSADIPGTEEAGRPSTAWTGLDFDRLIRKVRRGTGGLFREQVPLQE